MCARIYLNVPIRSPSSANYSLTLTLTFYLLSYLQAKEMVEGAPIVVKKGLKKDEADKLMKLIADAGGKAELL